MDWREILRGVSLVSMSLSGVAACLRALRQVIETLKGKPSCGPGGTEETAPDFEPGPPPPPITRSRTGWDGLPPEP